MLVFILSSMPAFLSCSGDGTETDAYSDTVTTSSFITATVDGREIKSVEFLIYSNRGIRELKGHYVQESGNCVSFCGEDGDYTAVALANCPFKVRDEAASVFDSAELLSVTLEDDNPDCPIMSGSAEFRIGEPCVIKLEPLLCSISVACIENRIKPPALLESPTVRLINANTSVELLRGDGFRKNDFTGTAIEKPLPCDVGKYTQYPGTTLFCYPNDSEDDILGSPATVLELECLINGEMHRFRAIVPALKKNSTAKASLTVESVNEYSFRIF